MIPLFLPEDVQAMDRRAFARGVDPAALMDRAAAHLARGVLLLAADRGLPRSGLRVALVCGKGNNGGDGIAAARHLARRGAAPTVVLASPAADLGPDAARELAAWRALRGRAVEALHDVDEHLRRADVVVDCVLGTGSGGAPRGAAADAVAAIGAAARPVVACDLPTGLDGADGTVAGDAVRADLTVTLGAHKRGLWVGEGPARAGRVVLGELDVVDDEAVPAARVLEAADLPGIVPPAAGDAEKRTRGVVAIWAGSAGLSGAAVLCARAALAAGAGLVTVATARSAADVVRASVPEAMTVDLPDDPADADALTGPVLDLVARADVLALGPGLGLAEATQQAVRRLVREVEVPVVLDADGINAFRDVRDALADRAGPLLAATPHVRELARLAGEEADAVAAQRLRVAVEVAERTGAVVAAKGPGTVVAAPGGAVWVNATGGPALATGGTGDALTGVVAALLAQRAAPEVVAAAVHLHGLAGDLAGRAHGVRGTTAGHVIDALGVAAERLGI